jgi:hypothetical protein
LHILPAHSSGASVIRAPLIEMAFPVPDSHPKPASEPPAMVRSATREDVMWNRPIFKAPPLELSPDVFNAELFAQELRRIGLGQR